MAGGRLPAALDPVNKAIGKRLRLLRERAKVSQETAAGMTDMYRQQWAKFEGGQNRIQASTIYRIAKRFQVPVSFFFEGLP